MKASRENDCKQINADYIYYKAAAICRKLYIAKRKNLWVGLLKSILNKKQRRGSKPSKTFRAGGKIIRYLVIQLKGTKYLENFWGEEELNHGLTLT